MMYPYPGAPWAPPTQPPSEPEPVSSTPHGLWPDRFSLVFAGVTLVVTLCAVALGAIAPAFSSRQASIAPAGWTKSPDGPIRDDGTWGSGSGCSFTAAGLDVQGSDRAAVCAFTPSQHVDLTSQGFALEVRLAPASQVQGNQRALFAVGGDADGAFVTVDQNGMYTMCRYSSEQTCLPNSMVAWHGNSYVSNTLAVRYLPDTGGGGSLALFANGEYVDTLAVDLNPGAEFGIGAEAGSEALYTHATVYTAGA